MRQPQLFASAVRHAIIWVHISLCLRACALATAMHAGAWQGTEGAQSASTVQASSLTTGSHREHPHALGPASDFPTATGVGSARGAVEVAASGGGGGTDTVVEGGAGGGGVAAQAPKTPQKMAETQVICVRIPSYTAEARQEGRACA